MLQGLIQPSSVTISMSTHPSPPKSSHLGAHQESTLMRLGVRFVKFKHAGAIKEVFYLEWLANTVVVKKKSGQWWV